MNLRRSVGFRNAVMFVIRLPVSPLAFFAAVEDKTTSRARRELESALISFESGAVAADLAIGSGTLLVFHGGYHTRMDGACVFHDTYIAII